MPLVSLALVNKAFIFSSSISQAHAQPHIGAWLILLLVDLKEIELSFLHQHHLLLHANSLLKAADSPLPRRGSPSSADAGLSHRSDLLPGHLLILLDGLATGGLSAADRGSLWLMKKMTSIVYCHCSWSSRLASRSPSLIEGDPCHLLFGND